MSDQPDRFYNAIIDLKEDFHKSLTGVEKNLLSELNSFNKRLSDGAVKFKEIEGDISRLKQDTEKNEARIIEIEKNLNSLIATVKRHDDYIEGQKNLILKLFITMLSSGGIIGGAVAAVVGFMK